MRILIHSNTPGAQTGYGGQAGQLGRGLAGLGHEVAFSAFWGVQAGVTSYHGMPVYPGGRDDFGMDTVTSYYRHWNADLLLTICDVWPLNADIIGNPAMKVACWTPIDTEPLGKVDEAVLRRTHVLPIAMSRHGEKMLTQAFFKPFYTPHGIDTALFSPLEDREARRAEMGLEGKFVVGINAANRDVIGRKCFAEQFAAFAAFAAKHKDAVLLVNTVADNSAYGGLNLYMISETLGLQDRMWFCDQDDMLGKMITDEALASWYGALDVLLNCSRGEGFGLPIIEAQACGTPVIVTRGSAMTELCGSGWTVPGQDMWAHHLLSWWKTPVTEKITAALETARMSGERKRRQAREFALGYNSKTVLDKYWGPILEFLEGR
jgi:glycosyltransferase involved in cell wall biosynthesis